MTTYVAGRDYPSDLPDEPESWPPKNLVASSQYTGIYAKVETRIPGGSVLKTYGLYYDVYLNEFNSGDEYPFVYRFVYWTVEGTNRPRVGFRPKPGERKVSLANRQFRDDPIKGRTVVHHFAAQDYDQYGNPVGGRILNYATYPDREYFATTSYGFPNLVFENADGSPITPSDFGWKPVENDSGTGYDPGGDPDDGDGSGTGTTDDGSTSSTPGNNEDSGGPGSGGDGDNVPEDAEPEQDPLPSINWFNKPTRWNPPLIGTATGAYVPVYMGDDEVDLSEPRTRDIFLGEYGIGARIRRKGYLRQYIINAEDFRVETGEVETEVENPDWDNNQAMIDLEKGWVYGFRFHYNPEQVAIGTQPILNIDPAFLTSGKEQAFPVAAEGSSVQFPIYLNRIEDVSFLRKNKYIRVRDLYKGYSKKDKNLLMGPTGTGKYLRQDIRGIRDRGTGYDLEFLYRTAMGRPFPTALRGDTADLGVILGLPMQLKLSKHINYVGRLTSLTYTHAMFSEEMVPMFTVVNLGFTRVPDAQSFGGAKE